MKEAQIVDLDGYMIDVKLVSDDETGVFSIYTQPLPTEGEEAIPPLDPVLIGYTVALQAPVGLYKPRFDFAAWEMYNQPPEPEPGEEGEPKTDEGGNIIYLPRPAITLWIEGLTQEELEEIRNRPIPPSLDDKVTQLQTESVETMLALTEVYESNEAQDAAREQESVGTMLALTEAYELILQQQAAIAELTARLNAIDGGGS